MMATITKDQVDLMQGMSGRGRKFGYVQGDDGGFFFDWCPTLEATLDSVEADAIDGDGGLDRSDVIDFLRDYLPTTARGKQMWDQESR